MFFAINQAELQDDYIQLGQKKSLEFFSFNWFREWSNDREETYTNIYLRIDKSYKKYERQIYSILELFGDIGGLAEAIHLIGLVLVGFIAS